MSNLKRMGVSMNKDVVREFDSVIKNQNYPTRSKAFEDLARRAISENALTDDRTEVVGSIGIIYDHHKRQLLNKLTDIQHDYQDIILSSQHVHVAHDRCFETVIVRGEKRKVERLAAGIKSIKGVMFSVLNLSRIK